jgi:transcriptional regulator with XRE-family HTH domain
MARRGARYTQLGKKIAALAGNQSEVAEVLGLTQQSVSGKLTGKIAVTLKDLDLLSAQYKVPLIYFVTSMDVTPEVARAWERILSGPPELHRTMELASDLPLPFAQQLLRTVQAMRNTAVHYTDYAAIVAQQGQPMMQPWMAAAEAQANYPEGGQ